MTRLTFSVLCHGQRLCVNVTPAEATYSLKNGKPLELAHHGRAFTLAAGQPATYPIPPAEPGPRPSQPPGREPERRLPGPA